MDISGTRLCPPASTTALAPALASTARAASTEVGAAYPNGGGFAGLLAGSFPRGQCARSPTSSMAFSPATRPVPRAGETASGAVPLTGPWLARAARMWSGASTRTRW